MAGRDEEEVVKLLFGDAPPSDWRDNPEFMLYLNELGNLGADRLAVEPDRKAEELSSVQMSTQELAFSNYKTFIQTSDCSKQIYNEFSNTEKHLENLIETMPDFLEKCEVFKKKAAEISTHRRMTSLTLSKHTTLLEILELPQLMDTVVRNQHYDEALELHAYVTKLSKKQPAVKILEDIARNVTNSVKLMLQQLLAQLRAPIQLPQCLKVISYLRRMDIFEESELRLKFLQARETWLQSVTNAVPRDDPYVHITRTMEVMRVHLFDIVTQYRAIFSDDNLLVDASTPCDNRLLFSSWLSRKVGEFLVTLEADLEQDMGSMESLLGQAMYFGLSFSRVGMDFRPLLVPIFEKRILAQFNKLVSFEPNAKVLSDSFVALNLIKIGGMPCNFKLKDDWSQPPLALIDFPPLAHMCNIVLTGLNQIRLCAPVSLVSKVSASINEFIRKSVELMVSFAATSDNWRETEKIGYKNFCYVFKSVLLPYLQGCLSAVFPPNNLSEICGFSVSDLQSRGLGFIDQAAACQPVLKYMPPEPEEIKTPPTPNGADETCYVADRMSELSVAVQDNPSEGQDTTSSNGELEKDVKPSSEDSKDGNATDASAENDENAPDKSIESPPGNTINTREEVVVEPPNIAVQEPTPEKREQ